MLRILTRNVMEPIRVSAFMQPEAPDMETYLTSQNDLEGAVAFLLNAAQLLDPDEVKFDITRLIFNQVGLCRNPFSSASPSSSQDFAHTQCLLLLL